MCLSSENSGLPFNKFYCSVTKYETNYKLGPVLQTHSPGLFFHSFENLPIICTFLFNAFPAGAAF